MADTIRDVVIRIRTEYQQGAVPNLSGVSSAAEAASQKVKESFTSGFTSSAKAAQQFSGQAADAIERTKNSVLSSAAQQIAAIREIMSHLDRQSEAYRAMQQQITQSIALREREAAASRREAEQLEKNAKAADNLRIIRSLELKSAFDRNRATEQVQQAAQAIHAQEQSSLRAAAAMRGLGESTMQVVRGFVLLGASGNKDAEKILHTLLQVQGAIDLYKGLIGILVQVGQAYRAVAASAGAAAAVQAASASIASGASGSTVGTAGVAAAAGAGAARFAPHAAVFGVGLAAGFGINELFDLTGKRALTKANEKNLRTNLEGIDAADLRNAGETRAFTGRQAIENEQIQARAAQGRLSIVGQIAAYERQIAAARQEAERATSRTGGVSSAGTAESVAAARKAALDAQLAGEKALLDVLSKQVQLREQQIQRQRQAVQLARDAVRDEKERNSSVFATLGSLNAGEQAELRRLNSKAVAGKELNEFELKFVQEKLGGAAADFVNSKLEDRGRKAFNAGEGISTLVNRAGGPLEGPESELARRQAEIVKKIENSAGEGLNKAIDAVVKAREAETAQLKRVAEAMEGANKIADLIERMAQSQERLQKRLARIEAAGRG